MGKIYFVLITLNYHSKSKMLILAKKFKIELI